MALQLWMPLMGDLRNQGLSNYSISTLGSISWVSGKLGALALKAGNGTQITNGVSINSNLTDVLAEEYSVSVWVKPLGDHVHYNGTILSSGDWNKKRWAFGVNQTNSKVDILSNGHNTYLDCSVPVNEWTNLICTCDSTNRVYLYKNGELIGSSQRSDKPASDASTAAIGRETYAGGYFSFNGVIQDLRLYNHCLSALEIKQLSQGLVLHYPLNRQGFGQENILLNTGDLTKWTTESGVTVAWDSTEQMYKLTDTHSGASRWGIYQNFTVTPNTKYTLTIEGKRGEETTVVGIGTYEQTASWPPNAISFTTTKTKYTYTFTSGSNHTVGRIYLAIVGDITPSEGWFNCPKLEKGSIATPWCPNSSDALATSMGLNGTIEYDCSGFCNNGTRTGTLNWTSDTPKYSVSTQFTGTQYITGASPTTSGATLAAWVKTTSTNNQALVIDYKSGLGMGFWSSYLICSCNSSVKTTFPVSAYTVNQWNHIVVVKESATTLSCYINGVKQTAGSTQDYWTTGVIDGFSIAARPNGASPVSCQVSDVRIYATALSATDVKSLYQNCATIDPDGTIRGQIRS